MLIQAIQSVIHPAPAGVPDRSTGSQAEAGASSQSAPAADSLLLGRTAMRVQKEYPESFAHEAEESLAATSQEADSGDPQAQRLLAKRQESNPGGRLSLYA